MMINANKLRITRFAPIEPDTINIEIYTDDDQLVAELIWNFDGSKSISIGSEKPIEIEAQSFIDLVGKLGADLDEWAADIRQPNGAWDPNNSYYTGQDKENEK